MVRIGTRVSTAVLTIIVAGGVGLSAAAQNTRGVFSPVVDPDTRQIQYRLAYVPEDNGFDNRHTHRLHGAYSLDGRRMAVIFATVITLIMLVVGVAVWGWYLEELGAMFIGLAIVAGYAGGLKTDDIAKRFAEGAAELVNTALIIGIARSIA